MKNKRPPKNLFIETVEKLGEEGKKIAKGVITAHEWMPDLAEKYGKNDENKSVETKAMADKKEEEKKEESQNKIAGRNIEDELKQLRESKKKEDEQLKKYQEAEEEKERQKQAEHEMMMEQEMSVSTNPSKQKKSRGSAFVHKKKSQPDQNDMSATSEFQKKVN
jgi:hypothetical protein